MNDETQNGGCKFAHNQVALGGKKNPTGYNKLLKGITV